MPEGDTIFRAARTLARAFTGKTVTGFQTNYAHLAGVNVDHPIPGRTVDGVRSVGKHLLFVFSGDMVLRTHMRMNGRWDIYRPGERWLKPRFDMRVVVETADFLAVGFNIPDAELLSGHALARHDIQTLGPDLLHDPFDEAEALRRLRARGGQEIGEALLNQHVMAGIGNVYKSEILFLCGHHPFMATSSLADDELAQIIATARRLLKVNVGDGSGGGMVTYGGLRRTTGRSNPSERLWVYGRGGEACRRCGTPLNFSRQGLNARVTYHCPICQPASQR